METANVDDAWEELPNAGEQEVGHETERIFWRRGEKSQHVRMPLGITRERRE